MVRARLVTEAVPVFERVRVRLAEAPMAMLPKLRAEGVIWRRDWMPMPVSGAVMGSEVSEVETATEPVRVPVWVGVKVNCSVQVVEGARVLPGVGQLPAAA